MSQCAEPVTAIIAGVKYAVTCEKYYGHNGPHLGELAWEEPDDATLRKHLRYCTAHGTVSHFKTVPTCGNAELDDARCVWSTVALIDAD